RRGISDSPRPLFLLSGKVTERRYERASAGIFPDSLLCTLSSCFAQVKAPKNKNPSLRGRFSTFTSSPWYQADPSPIAYPSSAKLGYGLRAGTGSGLGA